MIKKQKITGNILLFYAFDLGDEIDLHLIRMKDLIHTYKVQQSHYFKDYHVPLAFRMLDMKGEKLVQRQDAILNKIQHFGVVSFCYKIPFDDSFEGLKKKIIAIKYDYDKKSAIDAKRVLKKIMPAVKKPHFFNMKNDYFAVHVNPIEEKFTTDEFKREYGSKIASLLRLETEVLSKYQQDEILESTTGYYGEDLVIIDSEAAFVYDSEYYEPLEFFESATTEQLELQYYDRVLDKKLNYFYRQEPHKVPLKAYIPLLGRRGDLPVSLLARLRVDISVITERLKNSIKMTGDAYYSKLYSMIVDKFSLQEWRRSIDKKLDIIGDLHRVHHQNLESVREEVLTLVIIILIALEVVVMFFGWG